jgi:hypothetical protein
MDTKLVEALAELLVAIEIASDDELDPKLAVNLLEATASHLHELTPGQQVELRRLFSEIATRTGSDPEATILAGLADAMSLER